MGATTCSMQDVAHFLISIFIMDTPPSSPLQGPPTSTGAPIQMKGLFHGELKGGGHAIVVTFRDRNFLG